MLKAELFSVEKRGRSLGTGHDFPHDGGKHRESCEPYPTPIAVSFIESLQRCRMNKKQNCNCHE